MTPQGTIRATEALLLDLLILARQAAPAWRPAHEGEPPDEAWETPPDSGPLVATPPHYTACVTPGCHDEDIHDLDQRTGLCGMCRRAGGAW